MGLIATEVAPTISWQSLCTIARCPQGGQPVRWTASGDDGDLCKILQHMDEICAIKFLIDRRKQTKTNAEFFDAIKRK